MLGIFLGASYKNPGLVKFILHCGPMMLSQGLTKAVRNRGVNETQISNEACKLFPTSKVENDERLCAFAIKGCTTNNELLKQNCAGQR